MGGLTWVNSRWSRVYQRRCSHCKGLLDFDDGDDFNGIEFFYISRYINDAVEDNSCSNSLGYLWITETISHWGYMYVGIVVQWSYKISFYKGYFTLQLLMMSNDWETWLETIISVEQVVAWKSLTGGRTVFKGVASK